MRGAFSIVELIITIMLLGMIFVTVPALLSKSIEADLQSFEGEGLYHAGALLNRILSQAYNSVLVENIPSSLNLDGSYDDTPNYDARSPHSIGRIITPSVAADKSFCGGDHPSNAPFRVGSFTKPMMDAFDEYKNSYKQTPAGSALGDDKIEIMVPHFTRKCASAGVLVGGGTIDFPPDKIRNTSKDPNKGRVGMNEWNEYTQTIGRFDMRVRVHNLNDEALPFAPQRSAKDGIENANVSIDWSNLPDTPTPDGTDQGNSIVITVEVTDNTANNTPIGALRYVASNIGGAE
ncbi:MAG: hypothetical protein LBU73_05815 [Helicobacteraceae bacterium]|nr:hypothetical protein [Helicobacteraceae bacterium]